MNYYTPAFGNFALKSNYNSFNCNYNFGGFNNMGFSSGFNSGFTPMFAGGAGFTASPSFTPSSSSTTSNSTSTNNNTNSSNTSSTSEGKETASAAQEETALDVYGKGEEIFNKINQKTDDEDYAGIVEDLNSINKDNVITFLDGYYQTKNDKTFRQYSSEGIMEDLDDENDKGAIGMETKLNLVKSVIEAAKANGLDQVPKINKSVEELEKIYNQYTTGDLKNAEDFDNNKEFSWGTFGAYAGSCATAGAGIGLCFCGIGAIPGYVIGGAIGLVTGAVASFTDPTTDDERMDEHIEAIYQALSGAQG